MLRYVFGLAGPTGYSSSTTAEQIANANKNNIENRTFLVTGASAGLGFETVRVLAANGAKIIMACRAGKKAEEAAEKLREISPQGQIELMELDVGSLASVRAFVTAFRQKHTQLHGLICNAGIMCTPHHITPEGFESQLAANHLGHFLLTNLLLDMLQLSGPGSRVVVVSSEAHRLYQYPANVCATKIPFDNLKQEGIYHPAHAYGTSKLFNVLHAKELNEKLKTNGYTNVTAYSLHPGRIVTEIGRHLSPLVSAILWPQRVLFYKTIPQGAATTVFCAVDPKAEEHAGSYFCDCNFEPTEALSKPEYDTLRQRAWEVSCQLTNSKIAQAPAKK